jgi:hypothetical protein
MGIDIARCLLSMMEAETQGQLERGVEWCLLYFLI